MDKSSNSDQMPRAEQGVLSLSCCFSFPLSLPPPLLPSPSLPPSSCVTLCVHACVCVLVLECVCYCMCMCVHMDVEPRG